MTDVNNILGRVECELLKTQIFFADLRNENIWGVLDVLNRTVCLKLSCCYICSFIKFRWDSFCSKKVIYSWSEGFGQAILSALAENYVRSVVKTHIGQNCI